MQTIAWFREEMATLDQLLRGHIARPLSLAPDKQEITRLDELADAVWASSRPSQAVLEALTVGLRQVLQALIEHFPDNIFWDMDCMIAALASLEQPALVSLSCHKIAALLQRFGIHSAIRFQYAHDFTYGFDWARWVAKQPAARGQVPPYDLSFLAYLESRETELLELIQRNDQKYHQLSDAKPRNPFAFNRTPSVERQLHEVLAARQLVPVPAWELKPACTWQRDYTRLREEISRQLAKTGA